MPVFKLKKVWEYCTYNKPFFVFVLILFAIINFIENAYGYYIDFNTSGLIVLICTILLNGYGMTITRDRANQGYRLPKVLPRDIVILGIKSTIVFLVYLVIQGNVLDFVCSPLGFPPFDLEDMLFNFDETIRMLYVHNAINTLKFLIFGSISFYVTLFFMEIGLARLADTGRLLTAFNIVAIFKDINLVGWRHYARDCTTIMVAIVILGLLDSFFIPISFIEYLVDVVLSLLIFATQFLGIGAIYAEVKDKSSY